MPGGEIVVKREPSLIARARQAIDDAFKAAGRRLQDYARLQRGDVKSLSLLPEARVSRILPEEGYGFLTSGDGREIYFHKNSVLKRAFQRLKVGTIVRFVEEAGEKGPQASTVRVVSKQGIQDRAKGAAA
jgi:cold shock CspA family protein